MKSMLLSIMFCLISSVSWGMLHSAETALWTNLVENPGDGLIYKKFLTMPFTGTVMATADDPIQRSYIDGSKHGEWIEFNANGMERWSQKFGPLVKMDHLMGKMIQNDKEKEPFA